MIIIVIFLWYYCDSSGSVKYRTLASTALGLLLKVVLKIFLSTVAQIYTEYKKIPQAENQSVQKDVAFGHRSGILLLRILLMTAESTSSIPQHLTYFIHAGSSPKIYSKFIVNEQMRETGHV